MIDDLKKYPELLKATTNSIASILVLSFIATIVQMFSKEPPELWVSSINIAGTISIIFYMGMFNSNFTFFRWLIISKNKKYKLMNMLLGIMFFVFPILLNIILNAIGKWNFGNNKVIPIIEFIDYLFKSFIMIFVSITFYSFGFMIFILILMAIFTRKSIKND
ncbi:hypothetical protein [Staphylococcus edaphicus]|uniref:DUF5079 domain-containing protein n=1 Tax=Staphylococcus edaphicus TaxID=1955013 RepID=A0ABY4QC06_9STAP|nr:hypothetical protein [Staphylococcus edaphicus]UQW80972.1 hypothetical protein MNY58_10340 [Staphylococcus edaphicus]